MASAGKTTAVLGRPRDPGIDDAVLRATRDVLLEVGYPRLSIDLVARRAGVTRPTIYRRWSSKQQLVHDTLYRDAAARDTLIETGDFAADVRTLLRTSLVSYTRPDVRAALPGLIADLHEDAQQRSRVIDPLERPIRERFALLVQHAIDRGEIATDVDADAVFDLCFGALFYRVVLRGEVDPGFADTIAELLVRGTAT